MSAPNWVVPLSDVSGDAELVDAAAEAVRSGWWSAGPRVANLEEAFAEFTGAAHAIALNSGTAALHVALLALGAGPGEEVITPSLTFVAAANAVRHVRAKPVFCDVLGAHDLNLDPADVEAAITPRTRAIVALHYGGFPCDMAWMLEVAERNGIALIEDAAHAIGATSEGRACGTMGAFGCFSFFSNKNLPIGEGGMIVTNDDELAGRARLLRSHGMTTLTWDRHRGRATTYDVLLPGLNYRLDEIHAALALVQLGRLRAANARRARLADEYVRRLHGTAGLEVAFAERADRGSAAHHLAVVVLPEDVDREQLRARLTSAGVQTSVHYPPIHGFAAYRNASGRALPRTEALAERLLTLPLYPELSDELLELVTETLLESVDLISRGATSSHSR